MKSLDWPFRASEALDGGALTFRELRRFHEAVYPGVWVPRGVELSARQRARAAWLWSGRRGVPAGLSAAALHGAKWIGPDVAAELVHTNRRPPPLLCVHSDALDDCEIQTVAGIAVTTPARTAFDLGRRLPLDEAVQRIDALVNATGLPMTAIDEVVAAHPGTRGLRSLRTALSLVDGGAESPYETMTRLLLLDKGFPRPETQVRVCDERGRLFARLDLGWPEWRVGVDFDGAHHWTDARQRSWDVERYARLPELGWFDVRVTSAMLHRQPDAFLARVGAALIARGCPKTW
ncbi:endonuclease domain-containing protein [Mycobacterium sp. SMC-4]|uniref:endonuclease domain-containing protein n=1 Tax=Mycobacterium sp. SMC-4 TaxID=2857059 RepID=UPI003D084879